MKRTGLKAILSALFYGWGSAVIILAVALRDGRAPFAIPEILPILLAILAVAIVVWGRIVHAGQVRDEFGRRKRDVSPLHAARVAVLSQACIRCGTGLAGFFTMCAVFFFYMGDTRYVRYQVCVAAVTAVASAGLALAGWFAEKNCVSGGPGEGGTTGTEGAPTAA